MHILRGSAGSCHVSITIELTISVVNKLMVFINHKNQMHKLNFTVNYKLIFCQYTVKQCLWCIRNINSLTYFECLCSNTEISLHMYMC